MKNPKLRADMDKPRNQLGPDKEGGPDYILQDGVIYNWSESNIGYEYAWWLKEDGTPIDDSPHVRNLLKDRPFDPEWLKHPGAKYIWQDGKKVYGEW